MNHLSGNLPPRSLSAMTLALAGVLLLGSNSSQARLIERVTQRESSATIVQAMQQAGAAVPPSLAQARDTADPAAFSLEGSESDPDMDMAADRLMRGDMDSGFPRVNTRQLPVRTLDNNTIRQRYGNPTYATPVTASANQSRQTLGDTAAGAARAFVGELRDFREQALDRVQDAVYASARAAYVVDAQTGKELYSKNMDTPLPIASITKLMTAMVTLDARLDMNERITLDSSDFVGARKAGSNLLSGETFTRSELMLLALMKSENPAAAALARAYPGGRDGFMRAMNSKARQLGMYTAFFGDPTGLDGRNVASARDVVKLAKAAYGYDIIRRFSTTTAHDFYTTSGRIIHARNTNSLVREGGWQIGLSKTGFIREAGRCVVMQAQTGQRNAFIVLMGASDSSARSGDAIRILNWLRLRLNI